MSEHSIHANANFGADNSQWDAASFYRNFIGEAVERGLVDTDTAIAATPGTRQRPIQPQQQMYMEDYNQGYGQEYIYNETQNYDYMSEFDVSIPQQVHNSRPKFIVEQVGIEANTRYNVKDTKTGQVLATTLLPEAAKKISSLMNEGKVFSDMEVIKVIVGDTKFATHLNEMRKVKASIDTAMNESLKTQYVNKLNEMRTEAVALKSKI